LYVDTLKNKRARTVPLVPEWCPSWIGGAPARAWLASGADPKVVQRVLGHATAAMTMDLYGHMVDRNLWDAAQRGTTGARPDEGPDNEGGALAESHR
jgi:hypothetical protein